jgi:hypothetical protein
LDVWRLQFGSDLKEAADRQSFLQASVAGEVIERPGGLESALGVDGFDNPWKQMLGWGSDEKLETSPMKFGFKEKHYLLSFSWGQPSDGTHELMIHVQKPEQDTKASAGGKKSFMSRFSNSMSLKSSSPSKGSSGPSGTSNSFVESGTDRQEGEGRLGEVAGRSVLQESNYQRRLSVESKEIERHTGNTDSETSSDSGH